MARVTGLEPATSGVTGRHSNQLSYTRAFHFQPFGWVVTGVSVRCERSFKGFSHECQASGLKKKEEIRFYFKSPHFAGFLIGELLSTSLHVSPERIQIKWKIESRCMFKCMNQPLTRSSYKSADLSYPQRAYRF